MSLRICARLPLKPTFKTRMCAHTKDTLAITYGRLFVPAACHITGHPHRNSNTLNPTPDGCNSYGSASSRPARFVHGVRRCMRCMALSRRHPPLDDMADDTNQGMVQSNFATSKSPGHICLFCPALDSMASDALLFILLRSVHTCFSPAIKV